MPKTTTKTSPLAAFVTLLLAVFLASTGTASAQNAEFLFNVPNSKHLEDPYDNGLQSGARDVAGPVDLDGDGQMEVVVSDYTGGGRAHVIENVGVDTWEWAYSTPWVDSTASTNNVRSVAAGDLDGDGQGEIILFAGRNYRATSPLQPGMYVYEFNGTDFGDEPASIYEFDDHLPDRWRMERIEIKDIDGDGVDEIMWGNNGSDNASDEWYVLSVDGDIGGGFETWVEEVRLTSRAVGADPINRGGGSPYYIGAGDFDGDGAMDLTMHSWNNFNLTTGQVTGPDEYVFPDSTDENAFLRLTAGDQVALFGGTVVDIDQDGNDEVFYGNFQTGEAILLNYDSGESTLAITSDQVVSDIFGGTFTTLGIGSGDLDGDGSMEVFGTGVTYTGTRRTEGEAPVFIRIAEYQGGDVESPTSYILEDLIYSEPFDEDEFNTVMRRDSSGTEETYYEDGPQGGAFVSKFAYLGDADADGFNELAVAFQGIDDSTFVIQETFNDTTNTYDRTTIERNPNENRVFLRVLQGDGLTVKIVDERIILPSDYRLSENYPNPFNPSTTFSFTLPTDKAVSVKVYDVTGRLVRTLVDDAFHVAGTYEVTWDGTNGAGQPVASGTYLYALEWGSFRQSKTMVLVK